MPNVKATLSADISPFKRSLAEATTAITAFDRTTAQVNNDLKRFANEFSGAKIQREALTMARAIKDLGGALKLTDAEQKKALGTIDQAMAKYKALGKSAPADLQKISAELRTLQSEGAKVASSAGGIGQSLLSGLGIGIGAGAGLGVIQSIGSALRELAAEGVRLTPLRQSFESLQGGAAKAAATLDDLRVATRGLVSEADLIQAANKSTLLGLDSMGIQFAEVASVATKLGRAMGQDAAKSVDDLTTALARQSPQILDNLGIKLNLTEATAAYARSLGKSVEALTEEEKKLAFATAAMEAARQKAASLGETALTGSEQFLRLTNKITDTVAGIVSAGNASSVTASLIGEFADAVETLLSSLDELDTAFSELDTAFGDFIGATNESKIASQTFGQLLNVTVAPGIKALALAIEGTTEILERYRDVLRYLRGQGAITDLDVPGPSRGRDIRLGGTAGQGARAQAWLDAEEKRLQAEYEQRNEAKLRAIEARMEARSIKAKVATEKLTDAQRKLNDEAGRAFRIVRESAQGWEEYAGSVQLAWMEFQRFVDAQQRSNLGVITEATNPLSAIMNGPYLYRISGGLPKVVAETTDWAKSLQGVAQSFAQLAQIAGPTLDRITRGIGTVFGATDAARSLVDSLSSFFPSLQTRDAEGNLVPSSRGKAIAGVVGAATTGASLGSMTSNMALGGAFGAGGGLATGLMAGATGATLGLTAGVGAAVAIYMAWRNRQAEKKALSQQRAEMISAAGGYEQFQRAVERAGFSYDYFLQQFNSNNSDVFTRAMNELNVALAEQKTRADALVKGLNEVARVQGVLSQQQLAQIRGMREGDPGAEEVVAFMEGQRRQAESGLVQAVAALEAAGENALTRFGRGAQAAASGLYVAFTEALRQGESAIDVLRRLGGSIDILGKLGVGGEGFDELKAMQGILGGEQSGPAVQLAQGLGQALAGFANTGLLSPGLFGELANGIGEAYQALVDLGHGGEQAARLFAPYLQTVDKLIRDNPALESSLDDQTRALLEQARAAGLVGPQFDAASDRIVAALDKIIEKLDEFIQAMAVAAGLTLPTPQVPKVTSPLPGIPNESGAPIGDGPNGGDYTTPFAVGGIVTRPTRALIGEAGPEAVIPLARLRSMMTRGPVTLVTPVIIDGREVARAVNRYAPDERRLVGAA